MIIDGAPFAVSVDGLDYAIDTSFRCGIRVARTLDHPILSDFAKVIVILANFFPDGVPDGCDSAEAFKACMSFHALEAQGSANKRKPKRVYDWDLDISMLVSDFQNEYRIDLTDSSLEMHWWRFWMLFEGLSNTSKTMTAIGYRSIRVDPKLSKEEQKRLRAMQKLYRLPPRNISEVDDFDG